MKTFHPHWEVLPGSQRELWPQLNPIRNQGFVLYGGTAIALRLGHRQSIDFDFFSTAPLDADRLRREHSFLASAETIQDESNTLSVLTTGGVKLSFFGGLAFGRYGELEATDDAIMAVAPLEDLMALKLKVILHRSEVKDYLDLAALLQAGVSLSRALAIATQIYHPHLSPSIALKALTYFEGGDLAELPVASRKTLIAAATGILQLPEVFPVASTLHEAPTLSNQ